MSSPNCQYAAHSRSETIFKLRPKPLWCMCYYFQAKWSHHTNSALDICTCFRLRLYSAGVWYLHCWRYLPDSGMFMPFFGQLGNHRTVLHSFRSNRNFFGSFNTRIIPFAFLFNSHRPSDDASDHDASDHDTSGHDASDYDTSDYDRVVASANCYKFNPNHCHADTRNAPKYE
jgi:hypothetical protein